MSRSWSRGEAGGVPVGGSDASTRRPCERTSGCTHLENRLKYRDLDDPRFWTRLYVGRSATVDKTQVFRTRRSTRKRCVHPLVLSQGRRSGEFHGCADKPLPIGSARVHPPIPPRKNQHA